MLRRCLLLISVVVGGLPAAESAPQVVNAPPSAVVLSLPQTAVPAPTPDPLVLLAPVKTDHPRDTMRSFMSAMDNYVRLADTQPTTAQRWLDDAVRCLDLSRVPAVARETLGRDAARQLKDVIDRVILIDYQKIPDTTNEPRWRLRGSEIVIQRVGEGERVGEFLFSPETVARAGVFRQRVLSVPLLPGTLGGGVVEPWQANYVPAALTGQLFGVAHWQWLLLTVMIFAGIVIRPVVRAGGYLVQRLWLRARPGHAAPLIAVLIGPCTHLSTTGVWFASLHLLGISGSAYTVIAFLIKGAFFVNLAYLAFRLAGFLGNSIEARVQRQQQLNHSLILLLKQTLKIVALVFCLLLGAQNMGMDVASLIAGLGIGGLAFALAAKDTLANLLGSIMLMLDRPFRIGDYITAKGVEGTVEEIGFRCTRLRTPANSLLSMPNSELVLANIDNLGMRPFRRVREIWNLTYDTPPDAIDRFCRAIRVMLQENPLVRPDGIEVSLHNLGTSSLDIIVIYHLKVDSYSDELAARHQHLLRALSLARSQGVEFAFPTQTMIVQHQNDSGAPILTPPPTTTTSATNE